MADVSPRDAAGSPAPSSRRALGAGVLLLIVALGVPIAAIALTAAVPTGATAPHPAAGPVERPLPAPPATSVQLPQVDALPLVASEPRRPAVDRYLALHPGDASGAIDMFEAAWASLDAPADARTAIRAYRRAMLFDGQAGEGEDQAPFTSESFGTTAATAMAAVGRDAANAGHLNDAAVALFALAEASGPGGGGPGSSGSLSYNDAGRLQAAAIRLLTDASATFPSHRGLRINLAFLRNLFGDENSDPDVAIDDLRQFVASAPTDLTARLLLASLQARRWRTATVSTTRSRPSPMSTATPRPRRPWTWRGAMRSWPASTVLAASAPSSTGPWRNRHSRPTTAPSARPGRGRVRRSGR